MNKGEGEEQEQKQEGGSLKNPRNRSCHPAFTRRWRDGETGPRWVALEEGSERGSGGGEQSWLGLLQNISSTDTRDNVRPRKCFSRFVFVVIFLLVIVYESILSLFFDCSFSVDFGCRRWKKKHIKNNSSLHIVSFQHFREV